MLADPSAAARPGGKGTSVKAPLFDHAKMAAMLASATLVPMDAQHLPINTIRVRQKEHGASSLEINVPRDANIPGVKKKPVPTTDAGGQQQDDDADADTDDAAAASRRRRRRRLTVRPGRTRSNGLRIRTAAGKLTLLDEPAKQAGLGVVSPPTTRPSSSRAITTST